MAGSLVVFDIGGVLVRIHHTWDAILADRGLPPHSGPKPWRQAVYQPLSDYQDASLAEDVYLAQLGRDLGITAEQAFEVHGGMLVEDYPGAFELVQDLKAAGIATACLSNTNELHWRKLLDPRFHPAVAALDRPFASFEIQINKPHPGAYEAVAAAFPGVGRKFFFDDHPVNVEAARELGWEAHLIDPAGDPPAAMRAVLQNAMLLP